jgi:hypothetical protein
VIWSALQHVWLDLYPFDRASIGSNLSASFIWSVLIGSGVVLVYPKLRTAVHRFIDAKLEPLHERHNALDAKLDAIHRHLGIKETK